MTSSERAEVIARLDGYLGELVSRALKRPASEAGPEKAVALKELMHVGAVQILIDDLEAGGRRAESAQAERALAELWDRGRRGRDAGGGTPPPELGGNEDGTVR